MWKSALAVGEKPSAFATRSNPPRGKQFLSLGNSRIRFISGSAASKWVIVCPQNEWTILPEKYTNTEYIIIEIFKILYMFTCLPMFTS